MKVLDKPSLKLLSDEEVIAIVATDRAIALDILYSRYSKLIYYKALSLLKTHDEALDLTHDIFIKIFTSLDQFQGRSKFSLWVHSITFNTCIKYLKDKKRISMREMDDEIGEKTVDHAEEDLTEKLLLNLKLDAIERSMTCLKEIEKSIVLMKYMDQLSVNEIVEITGLKASNIKMKLLRARQKMLAWYKKSEL